jgi:hypothetical protein
MTTSAQVDEGALIRHSFDVVHFPMYLDRNGFTQVRFETTEDSGDGDVVGYFTDEAGSRAGVYVKLIKDPDGVSVTTDQFFYSLHDLFQKICAPGHTYIGFTRLGKPVYAPLFALALLYKKYGRGLYEPGDVLPTPCAFLTSGYELRTL